MEWVVHLIPVFGKILDFPFFFLSNTKQYIAHCAILTTSLKLFSGGATHMARCSEDSGGVTNNSHSNGFLSERSLFPMMNQTGCHFCLLKMNCDTSQLNQDAA